jgi:putative salt-induced outer membrane protein
MIKSISFVVATAVATLTAGSALAQAAKAPDGQFHGGASAGVSIASGNATSNSINLNAETARETTADKIVVYGAILRGTSGSGVNKVTAADLYRFGGRYERNFSDRLYGFGGAELERDGVAKLNLRTSVNAGVGYKVIVTDPLKFNVFGGVAYGRNDYKDPLVDTKGASLMLGEESIHTLSKDTSFRQRLELYPAGGDLGTRAKWDAGFVTALAGNLTANANLGLRYASKVPAGIEKNDTVLSFGVGYKF